MVAQALDISRETYFAILMDRGYAGPVMVGSPAGGMDIEEVAAKTPELIFKEGIDITVGVTDEQALQMAKNLEFKGPQLQQVAWLLLSAQDDRRVSWQLMAFHFLIDRQRSKSRIFTSCS